MSSLIPQEVYLLERYSSLEYFRPMRDQWDTMVKHVEKCLEVFMKRLPSDYQQRPRPHQPDIVWGERVLPNFRSTQQNLFRAYIRLSHGDLNALAAANGVTGGFRGVADYSPEWMGECQVLTKLPDALDKYWAMISAPQIRAQNISRTYSRIWTPGTLAKLYNSRVMGPLDPPERWPRYRLNADVRVEEGSTIPKSGIYLPDISNSCAALLIEGDDWTDALVVTSGSQLDALEEPSQEGQSPDTEWRPTGWTLIERIPGETIPFEEGLGPNESRPQRVPAGEQCPRAGWWYTPAKPGPRRFFSQGGLFPRIEGSDYGDTFWIWSPDQSDPKL